MKKKAPKKLRPAMAKNLKEISEKLQSQANDIAADVYVSQIKSKGPIDMDQVAEIERQRAFESRLPPSVSTLLEDVSSDVNELTYEGITKDCNRIGKDLGDKLDKAFPELPPLPETKTGFGGTGKPPVKDLETGADFYDMPLGYTMKKDYSTVLDCLAAMSMLLGSCVLGWVIGVMR